jgi:uncharacterized lipoprotein YmbA
MSKRIFSAACMALLLAGCGTPAQERFFTLASEPAPQTRASTASVGFTIVVGPVTVPEAVDRPQMVIRADDNRVVIAEEARWVAPLKSEIPRVIADHLARLLDGARTATSTQRASTPPDYRVLIDIQRFESAPQQGATIQAQWTVTRTREPTPINGRSLVTERAGAGYDELVAAHSRALAAVSRDIAAAIGAARTSAK